MGKESCILWSLEGSAGPLSRIGGTVWRGEGGKLMCIAN